MSLNVDCATLPTDESITNTTYPEAYATYSVSNECFSKPIDCVDCWYWEID